MSKTKLLRKKRKREDDARQAAVLKKNLAAERAALERFKEWEQNNA